MDNTAVTSLDLPTYDDVVEASKTIDGVAHPTPVLTSRTLDDQLGVSVDQRSFAVFLHPVAGLRIEGEWLLAVELDFYLDKEAGN